MRRAILATAFLGLLAQACSGTDAASQPDEESVGHGVTLVHGSGSTLTSSTWNMMSEFGGMSAPAPRAP